MRTLVTRWDPSSRAGAVAVRQKAIMDIQAIEAITDATQDWARYLDLTGEQDAAETSPTTFRGTYDWRAYLAEEAEIARRREERAKPAPKKQERAEPAPAPSVFYA